MANLTELKHLQATLRKLQKKYGTEQKVTIVVGYTAAYALWVHEAPMKLKGLPRGAHWKTMTRKDGVVIFDPNILKTGSVKSSGKGFYWDPQGRAQRKFLEQPAREMQGELGTIIEAAVKNGATLEKALLVAGLRLQRESQKLVPVDTGNLKNSSFTRKED